jgi:putative phage-type endonuclease
MDRTKGIGGTDIAAIVGLNPWKSPIDVYMEKLDLVEPQADNDNLWWGREMEPVLQKRYEQETGLTVEPWSKSYIIDKIKYNCEWYQGTPDGLIIGLSYIGGVDYKTTGSSYRDQWGEPGSDEVPAYYHTQAMWYMGLTGAIWWDVAVLFMGARREFRIYRINRDDELIDSLIERGRDFWENNVLKEVPPPVDASKGWDTFFKAKWPKEEEDIIRLELADSSTDRLLINYKTLRNQLSDYQEIVQSVENNIKALIGNHSGIDSQYGKITWKATKNRTKVDWEGVAKYLSKYVDDSIMNNVIDEYTTTTPGPRVFRVSWNKEE